MDSSIEQNKVPLTVEEFFAICGKAEERYELIDGVPYMMGAPNDAHQSLSMFLSIEIGNFLKGKKCKVFAAPYDVFLNESPRDRHGKLLKNKRVKGTVVQPDLVVICDKDKRKSDGCHGAPDLVVEILSKSSENVDIGLKLEKYLKIGVKEYWVVNPDKKSIDVYNFSEINETRKNIEFRQFTFNDKIKSQVLDGLEIDFSQFEFDL